MNLLHQQANAQFGDKDRRSSYEKLWRAGVAMTTDALEQMNGPDRKTWPDNNEG